MRYYGRLAVIVLGLSGSGVVMAAGTGNGAGCETTLNETILQLQNMMDDRSQKERLMAKEQVKTYQLQRELMLVRKQLSDIEKLVTDMKAAAAPVTPPVVEEKK